LYPSTWAVNREATETIALGGYEIPAGTQVMIPQWVLHRDDRFWEEPETFEPSRWEGDTDRPEYAYFPFGGGPRHCIGIRFARLELVLALATMVSRVDLDVSVAEPLTFGPLALVAPRNRHLGSSPPALTSVSAPSPVTRSAHEVLLDTRQIESAIRSFR
jgi:cytochrome P450